MEHGLQRFANYKPLRRQSDAGRISPRYSNRDHVGGGAFSWEEVASLPRRVEGPLVAKASSIREDALKAVPMECDSVVGIEPWWPTGRGFAEFRRCAAGDCPRARIGVNASPSPGRLCVRPRHVTRALALGANAAFAGKAILSMGSARSAARDRVRDRHVHGEIPRHVRQCGVNAIKDARKIQLRHPGARNRIPDGGPKSAPSALVLASLEEF